MENALHNYIFGGMKGISKFICNEFKIAYNYQEVILRKIAKNNTILITDLNMFVDERVEELVKSICYYKFYENSSVSMENIFKSNRFPFTSDDNPSHYDSDNKKLAINYVKFSNLDSDEKEYMINEIENFSFAIDILNTFTNQVFEINNEAYLRDLHAFIGYIQLQEIEVEIRLKKLADIIKLLNKSILANQEILNSRAYKYKKECAQLVNEHLDIIKSKIYSELTYYVNRLDVAEYQNILEDREPREFLLGRLIENKSKLDRFLNLEKQLVQRNYLSVSLDKWHSTPINFIYFYVFCEQNNIFNQIYEPNSKGVKILRKLYNFEEGVSVDKPCKRKKYKKASHVQYFSFSSII